MQAERTRELSMIPGVFSGRRLMARESCDASAGAAAQLEALRGSVVEVVVGGRSAGVSVVAGWVAAAHARGELAAWLVGDGWVPVAEDLVAAGVDLAALVLVRCGEALAGGGGQTGGGQTGGGPLAGGAAEARSGPGVRSGVGARSGVGVTSGPGRVPEPVAVVDRLVRSGGFGIVVVQAPAARVGSAALQRVRGLAERHGAVVVWLVQERERLEGAAVALRLGSERAPGVSAATGQQRSRGTEPVAEPRLLVRIRALRARAGLETVAGPITPTLPEGLFG